MSVVVRPAKADDKKRWAELWSQYVDFYRGTATEDMKSSAWSRIMDPQSKMHCLVAERDGVMIGLCNYLFHDTFWGDKPYCYLEDLFVDPAARGGGAAKALILACEAEAKAKGASRLYWNTQEYNAPARSLYDTVANRSSFVVYRKPL